MLFRSMNGFPKGLVVKTIKESCATELRKSIQLDMGMEDEEEKEFYDVLHIPYIENFSGFIQKELRRINVGVVMKKNVTIESKVCKGMKQEKAKEDKKELIYMINCKTCNMPYIGETSQVFRKRRNQHQASVRRGDRSNGIFDHLEKFKDHEIAWEDFKFLDLKKLAP